ncbi:hypothetical protein KUCAC02_012691 [Xyrichtys novacula]|uniref:Uncharacterized protein n=1 Tax=Xyrichtys novacula TaxID=13765 RepID=A0AAV1F266_XYRNO|nr:hypothetical protein KUCAC02_012691 [Xyrichtys novacula]
MQIRLESTKIKRQRKHWCVIIVVCFCLSGICSYKDKYYKAGESFRRGCDKCFCHDFGAYCFTPMKPTSWPRKCRRVRAECGYTVVYKEDPQKQCQAYSWIG